MTVPTTEELLQKYRDKLPEAGLRKIIGKLQELGLDNATVGKFLWGHKKDIFDFLLQQGENFSFLELVHFLTFGFSDWKKSVLTIAMEKKIPLWLAGRIFENRLEISDFFPFVKNLTPEFVISSPQHEEYKRAITFLNSRLERNLGSVERDVLFREARGKKVDTLLARYFKMGEKTVTRAKIQAVVDDLSKASVSLKGYMTIPCLGDRSNFTPEVQSSDFILSLPSFYFEINFYPSMYLNEYILQRLKPAKGIASVVIFLNGSDAYFYVSEIQRSKKRGAFKKYPKWPHLLLGYVEKVAREVGAKAVLCSSAEIIKSRRGSQRIPESLLRFYYNEVPDGMHYRLENLRDLPMSSFVIPELSSKKIWVKKL